MRPLRALVFAFTFALAFGLVRTAAGGGAERISLSVDEAVGEALRNAPELLDAADAAARADAGVSGARALFRPQLSPFWNRTTAPDGTTSSRFGAAFSQQFAFGPRLAGSLDAGRPADGGDGYATAYGLSLTQPLLRGADPVVTREPLRAAERARDASRRSLAATRRRTVLAAWAAYLDVARGDELVRATGERVARAETLRLASEAKLAAGSLSRLDVLRAEQLVAAARVQESETRDARDDAHEVLARLLGRPPGTRFLAALPERLPVASPDEAAALAAARLQREEVVEAKERVTDAEVALRIAKSQVLPALDAVAGWSASGVSSGLADAFTTPGKSTWTLGFRSRADANVGAALSAEESASVALRTERRNAALVEDDVARAVQQAARRLRTARERDAIDAANLAVARMQRDVATLRFEKGLSDNFPVVDAENLFNAAQLSALASRQAVLLAELSLLVEAALLDPSDFTPDRPRR